MSSFDQQFTIDSPTGATLNCYYTAAKSTAFGIVHVNHGLAEHAARYVRFARDLSNAGFHAYAHDHRGHGYTKAPDAPLGAYAVNGDGVAKVLSDCAAIQDHAKQAHPDLPLVMFGHSMGGLITMNFALRHADKLAGAAIWNSNFSGGILGRLAQAILKYEQFRLGSDVPSRILPKLTFDDWAKKASNARTNFDWLSHIEEEVNAYIADPLCGWDASVGLWRNIFEMVFSGGDVTHASKAAHALPFFLLGGGEDPATDKAKAVRAQVQRMKKAGFKHLQEQIFPNARHETLNDRDAEAATLAFTRFAKNCCAD